MSDGYEYQEDPDRDDDPYEPFYDCEDIGCACTAAGIDSEWQWEPDQNCYVCSGCGAVQ